MSQQIPDVPERLVEAVAGRRAILFAGAGVSRGEIQTAKGTAEQYLPG